MKNTNGNSRSKRTRRTFSAHKAAQARTARQALKLAFYHLDAARFLLLAHRVHLDAS